MSAKLVIIALLGAAFISAVIPANDVPNQDTRLIQIEFKTRNNLSKYLYIFLKNIMDPANRIPAAAGVHYEELMKMLVELKGQVSMELEELKKQLDERSNEAKKYDEVMYKEIKRQADEIFQKVSFEYKDQIRKLDEKLSNEFDELDHQQIVHH